MGSELLIRAGKPPLDAHLRDRGSSITMRRLVLIALALHGREARSQPATSPTDEKLIEMAQQETIEIFDERPNKPFDRDTEVRMTGEQLAERGAVDLATALA